MRQILEGVSDGYMSNFSNYNLTNFKILRKHPEQSIFLSSSSFIIISLIEEAFKKATNIVEAIRGTRNSIILVALFTIVMQIMQCSL